LFPLFATGVIYTGGKFAAGVIDTGGNLPPASLTPITLAKMVEKFAACVVDTGGNFASSVIDTGANLPPVSLIPVVNLDMRICPRIFEKFETVSVEYFGAGGKLIHEKNQRQKIS
jgi:hypothetical protein